MVMVPHWWIQFFGGDNFLPPALDPPVLPGYLLWRGAAVVVESARPMLCHLATPPRTRERPAGPETARRALLN